MNVHISHRSPSFPDEALFDRSGKARHSGSSSPTQTQDTDTFLVYVQYVRGGTGVGYLWREAAPPAAQPPETPRDNVHLFVCPLIFKLFSWHRHAS